MDKEIIFMSVIALFAFGFCLTNIASFLINRSHSKETQGTIISFRTINPSTEDVYKRQAYYFIDELQVLGEIPLPLQNYIDYEAYGRDSVSYTHLDVYKRQLTISLASLPKHG